MLHCGYGEQTGALVMLGGALPAGRGAERIRELAAQDPPPLLIAADHGADHLAALGLQPQLIVGDNDSLLADFPGVQRLSYAAEKDFSDGAAALHYAAKQTGGLLAVAGMDGGRIDHWLHNLLLPLTLAEPRRLLLLGDEYLAAYSQGYCQVEGKAGQTVSLIPLTAVEGICLQGFRYPLDNYHAALGDSRTLSNVLGQSKAEIRHSSGILLVIHYDC